MGRVNITDFLRQYENKETKKSYKTGLKQFFNLIYSELKGEDLDIFAERYLSENRDHQEDMINFRDSLKDRSPNTRALRFNAIRAFLDDNGISFTRRFYKNLNSKAVEPITWEKVPTNDELKRIVEYMPIQGKALALLLSSSGSARASFLLKFY